MWSTSVNSSCRIENFAQIISEGATAAAAGNGYSIVLKQDGSVWKTTQDSKGRFTFSGESTDSSHFSMIPGAIAVAAGGHHSMVLKHDGSVWTTGDNKHGQLGRSSTRIKDGFVKVISSGARAIAAGKSHSMTLKHDGSVWVTGYNEYGQLGDGSAHPQNSFIQVTNHHHNHHTP